MRRPRRRPCSDEGLSVVARHGRRSWGRSTCVRAGEFFAVVGPSGCGKSTLLEVIAGSRRPRADKCFFNGVPVGISCLRASASSSRKTPASWLSVRENIGFGLKRKVDADTIRRSVDDALQLTGLKSFADAYPAQLSGGCAARLHRAYARAQTAPDPARRTVRRARPANPSADGVTRCSGCGARQVPRSCSSPMRWTKRRCFDRVGVMSARPVDSLRSSPRIGRASATARSSRGRSSAISPVTSGRAARAVHQVHGSQLPRRSCETQSHWHNGSH